MSRRVVSALIVVVLLAGAFGLGYAIGARRDRSVVPDMLGMGTEDGGQAAARRALKSDGLRLGKVSWRLCAYDEHGLIVVQNPAPGSVVPTGSTVDIQLGSGRGALGDPEPDQCLEGEQIPFGMDG
ncbi:MAG TPA: PASTA domain-containing protein [Actinomycetota bacterium]